MNFLPIFTHFAVNCQKAFLGFPHWYEYLKLDDKCQVTDFHTPGDLALVAVAIVDILIRLIGMLAVFFVIYGGIQYVMSQGEPEATVKARNTIVNALIGLALSIIAVGFVSFLGNQLAK